MVAAKDGSQKLKNIVSAKKAKLHKKVAKPKDAALARAVHARRAARREVEGRREPPEAEAGCRARR